MYRIDKESCIGCNACESVCLGECIKTGDSFARTIDKKGCTGCNACIMICPADCIHKD